MRFGLRELIFVMVLLAVPVASFIFVFKPRNVEIQQAQQEIEVKVMRLEQLREVTSRIDDIGLAIREWEEAVKLIEAKLPSEQGIEEILEQVWNITRSNRLEIRSTHAEAPEPTATYMELPLKIEMHGDFDGFYQFLLELEQLPRITRIHNLKIQRASGAQRRSGGRNRAVDELPEGSMIAEFTLSIYYESSQARAAGK